MLNEHEKHDRRRARPATAIDLESIAIPRRPQPDTDGLDVADRHAFRMRGHSIRPTEPLHVS